MNKLKITLNEDGSVQQFAPDFKIMRGSYRNILINIEVPKSLLTEIAVDDNGEYVNGNNVRIAGVIHTALGQNIQTKRYELKWVKDYTLNGIEYSLYQRKMPKEFTIWETYNSLEATKSGRLDMIINVVNWSKKFDFAKIEEIASSSYVQLSIYPGAFLEGAEEIADPTDFDLLQSQVQEINKNVEQFKVDQDLLLEIKETADDAKQTADDALDRVVAGIGTIVTKDGKKQDVFNADEKVNEKDLSQVAKSGEYKDLKNIPTDIANHEWVLEKIAELINSAPETLNTLGELAVVIQNNDELINTLNSAIANKVSNDAFNAVVNTKVDTNQGDDNANKTMVTDDDGNIIPLALHLKSEDRYTIDFAESERQKSKNLFDINAIRLNKSMYGGTGGSNCGEIANHNDYFVSDDIYVHGLSNIILSGNIGDNNVSVFLDENKVPFRVDNRVSDSLINILSVPEDAYYFRFECAKTYIDNSNIQLEEGTVATDYQPYQGGRFVQEGDIADVEHFDVLYDKESGKTTLGGLDYSSGIQGGVTVENLDLSKYKFLRFTLLFGNYTYGVMLLPLCVSPPSSTHDYRYWSSSRFGGDSADNNTMHASIYVDKNKTSITYHNVGWYRYNSNTIEDRMGNSEYYISRIEGVY